MDEETITVRNPVERRVQVETFEHEDAEWAGDETPKEEYLALAEKLGLKGQQAILTEEGAIPFQRMNTEVLVVYATYCPTHVSLEAFNAELIPMRVLRLLDRCTDKQYFERIEVWTENEETIDPVAVGFKGKARYLIARWGESLKSYPEVVASAKRKWQAKREATQREKIADAEKNLKSLDHDWNQKVAGAFVWD